MEALALREKYSMQIDHKQDPQIYDTADFLNLANIPNPAPQYEFAVKKGVFQVAEKGTGTVKHLTSLKFLVVTNVIPFEEFARDFNRIEEIVSTGACKTLAYERLKCIQKSESKLT